MDDLLPYLLVWLAVTVPGAVVGWVGAFRKAGLGGWKALVPVYNVFVLVVDVAKLSPLWAVLLLIPGVNLIAALLVNVEVARRFGRTESFGLGLAVFGFVFYPVLGFGPAKYQR
ncbi:MAG TPA: DUF5684 domain-containing protein [Urbifossiella sp.]|jgi:hypothetical protein|nr:DUF5684 domain-containing protein [Urbifossiella sp.]